MITLASATLAAAIAASVTLARGRHDQLIPIRIDDDEPARPRTRNHGGH